jgi:hypothetical protein
LTAFFQLAVASSGALCLEVVVCVEEAIELREEEDLGVEDMMWLGLFV